MRMAKACGKAEKKDLSRPLHFDWLSAGLERRCYLSIASVPASPLRLASCRLGAEVLRTHRTSPAASLRGSVQAWSGGGTYPNISIGRFEIHLCLAQSIS